jgi:transcriptional activator SPT7
MRAAINPVGGEGGPTTQAEHSEPPPWDPVSADSIDAEIGLIQPFLRSKLASSQGPYIIEDENLPIKQRPAKPRLPPTGKINTPRKRKDVPGAAGGSAKKKKKPPASDAGKPAEVVPTQLPTPPMGMIREEDGSDNDSLFGGAEKLY